MVWKSRRPREGRSGGHEGEVVHAVAGRQGAPPGGGRPGRGQDGGRDAPHARRRREHIPLLEEHPRRHEGRRGEAAEGAGAGERAAQAARRRAELDKKIYQGAERELGTLCAEPGSPLEDAYSESFNSRLRDGSLNVELLSSGKGRAAAGAVGVCLRRRAATRLAGVRRPSGVRSGVAQAGEAVAPPG